MHGNDLQGSSTNVAQIGEVLAEAFLARIARFSPTDRIKLLKACRDVLKANPEVASIFFSAD